MKTKFGNANINKGYYCITSTKEGNHGKKLHRLIWEDFYNTEVPKGYVIHHRNFNKLDNCILNLQLMRREDHMNLHKAGENHHFYGKTLSDEHELKISETMNTSGYFRVRKQKRKKYKQGFIWLYRYYEDGKRKSIYSISLEKLEAKVKSKGLLWKKLKKGEL